MNRSGLDIEETCVPVQALIAYVEAGDRIDDFLADYPTRTREQALAALQLRGTRSVAMPVPLDEFARTPTQGAEELRPQTRTAQDREVAALAFRRSRDGRA